MRVHGLATVLQAIVRGMQVRAWFRAALAAAASGSRVPSREYFRRLADIGSLKRAESTDGSMLVGNDALAEHVRPVCGPRAVVERCAADALSPHPSSHRLTQSSSDSEN